MKGYVQNNEGMSSVMRMDRANIWILNHETVLFTCCKFCSELKTFSGEAG